jgi:hypothetical protein
LLIFNRVDVPIKTVDANWSKTMNLKSEKKMTKEKVQHTSFLFILHRIDHLQCGVIDVLRRTIQKAFHHSYLSNWKQNINYDFQTKESMEIMCLPLVEF